MLLFGAESFVFQFAIKKKDKIQNYNFAPYFVWVSKLVANIDGGT